MCRQNYELGSGGGGEREVKGSLVASLRGKNETISSLVQSHRDLKSYDFKNEKKYFTLSRDICNEFALYFD